MEYRYLQFVAKDRKKIDVLRILDVAAKQPITEVALLGEKPTLYWIQSLCNVLVEDERFTYIGNGPGAREIPALRRRFFRGWIVVENGSERFVSNPIGTEVANISLEQGVPAQVIVDRLSSGWRPESDREDIGEMIRHYKQRERAAGIEATRETTFFIDFLSAHSATEALAVFERLGYSASRGRGEKLLDVTRSWAAGETLGTMDAIEVELAFVAERFDGKITGRETSA